MLLLYSSQQPSHIYTVICLCGCGKGGGEKSSFHSYRTPTVIKSILLSIEDKMFSTSNIKVSNAGDNVQFMNWAGGRSVICCIQNIISLVACS